MKLPRKPHRNPQARNNNAFSLKEKAFTKEKGVRFILREERAFYYDRNARIEQKKKGKQERKEGKKEGDKRAKREVNGGKKGKKTQEIKHFFEKLPFFQKKPKKI